MVYIFPLADKLKVKKNNLFKLWLEPTTICNVALERSESLTIVGFSREPMVLRLGFMVRFLHIIIT